MTEFTDTARLMDRQRDEVEAWDTQQLLAFVRESNAIENILREPTDREVRAHIQLIDQSRVTIEALEEFVGLIGGGPLRELPTMNVRVGRFFPPKGGPHIRTRLSNLLDRVQEEEDPFLVHVWYETLHPFLDGNGRSGRALWAWQTLNQKHWPNTLRMGFLRPAYYATLRLFGPMTDGTDWGDDT